jgi:hypothetical protein
VLHLTGGEQGHGGAVAARPGAKAQRGVMALRDEGKPALPTGVPMSKLDGGTWRQPATEGRCNSTWARCARTLLLGRARRRLPTRLLRAAPLLFARTAT